VPATLKKSHLDFFFKATKMYKNFDIVLETSGLCTTEALIAAETSGSRVLKDVDKMIVLKNKASKNVSSNYSGKAIKSLLYFRVSTQVSVKDPLAFGASNLLIKLFALPKRSYLHIVYNKS